MNFLESQNIAILIVHVCLLILEREQKEAASDSLKKDVLAVLPTGFGKGLIYQSVVLVKERDESSVDLVVLEADLSTR